LHRFHQNGDHAGIVQFACGSNDHGGFDMMGRELSLHILLPQRLIRPILDFEDNAATLQHFQAMPLAGGDVNAVLAFEGVEQKRFAHPAIAVVKKDLEPAM